jgi:nitroreductase
MKELKGIALTSIGSSLISSALLVEFYSANHLMSKYFNERKRPKNKDPESKISYFLIYLRIIFRFNTIWIHTRSLFLAKETTVSILPQIENRRAKRALSEKPIPQEILDRLLQASILAPSCANTQPWRFVTVSEPQQLTQLKTALTPGNYWALKAPAITALVTSHEWGARLDHGRDYAFFDLGQASMAYQLQAIEEGLCVHPIAGFDAALAKKVLGIPESAVLVTLVILGYPGDSSHLNEKHLANETSPRTRKPLEEVASSDRWDVRLEPRPIV